MRTAVTGRTTGGARIAVTIALVLVAAIGLLLVVRARPEPGALDPRSNRPDGTRALVLLLEELGATVEITRAAPAVGEDTRVLVLVDSLDDDVRDRLEAFVAAGGIAVVADPASTLHGGATVETIEGEVPGRGSAAEEANVANVECDIAALDALRGVFVRDGVLFDAGDADASCFSDDGRAFVIRHDVGDGSVIGLGDNALLTNELIDLGDNGGLATALLLPGDHGHVTFVLGDSIDRTPDEIGSGDETLGDLIRPSVWMGIVQLAVAFVVLAVAQGVRSGRVVDEPLPSPLAGSDAVRARATMMHRARHAGYAAWLLRSELHRSLCDRYHLPRTATVDEVDRAASDRDGFTRGEVRDVLVAEPGDAAGVVALGNTIASIRARLDGATTTMETR